MTRRSSLMGVWDSVRDAAHSLVRICFLSLARVSSVIQKTFRPPNGMPAPVDADARGSRPRLLCRPFTSRREGATRPVQTAQLPSPAWASLGVTHVYDRHGYAKGMKLVLDEWGARLERLRAAPAGKRRTRHEQA